MYLPIDDRVEQFAIAYIRYADVEKAAAAVGLSADIAFSLYRRPETKYAIQRALLDARRQCALVAVRVGREVAEDQVGSPPAARTAAARLLAEIGDLVGTSREQTRDDRETHELSSDELHAKIVDIERELGNRAVTVSCPLPADLIDLY